MTKSSRAARREAARTRQPSSSNRLLLPLIGVGVVLVAAVAAIALTSGGGSGAGSTPEPSVGATAVISNIPAPTITGSPLPAFPTSGSDPAKGMAIPEVKGEDFKGTPVSITNDGKPKVIMFLAHWCVHCQAEVPVVAQWIKQQGMPAGVELVAVATGSDPAAPNYPPDAWFAREDFTVPTIVDTKNEVAKAYGLSAYPFWVFVGANGAVAGRMTGELPIADLQTIISSLPK